AGDGDPTRLPFRAAYLAAQVALAVGRLTQAAELVGPLVPLLPLTGNRFPVLACRVRLLAAEACARRRQLPEAHSHLNDVSDDILDGNPLLRLRALRVRLWLGEVADLGEELAACARALDQAQDAGNLALLACEEGRAWDIRGDLARAEACWRRAERVLGVSPEGHGTPAADVHR